MRKIFMFVLPAVLAMALPGSRTSEAGDWPQYRGPTQDGVSTEKLNPVWPAQGPKLLWKIPLNEGYSSFAVNGDKVFTQVTRDNKGEAQEYCIALDASTGKELWAAAISSPKITWRGAKRSEENTAGGPRSTPTVNEGKVYVYPFDMKLTCLEAETGKQLWQVDVVKDYEGRVAEFGNAESPVIEGDMVIVAGGGPGESILALNKNTGKLVWKNEDAEHLYSTPKVAVIQGERQLVYYMKNDLMGISVKDGKRLWRSPVTFHTHNCMQPVVFEDKVYCGNGTDGTGVYQIIKEDGGFHSKRLWMNGTNDSPIIATPIFKDGYLYGGLSLFRGDLKCLEFATGKVIWKKGGIGEGSGILVGDTLVFLSDKGKLLLIEAKPVYKEIAVLDKAIAGLCYSTPALSNGRLYIRSSKEGACYDLNTK